MRHYWHGTAHVRRYELGEARDSCTRALEAGGALPEVLVFRALVRASLGDPAALDDHFQAVALDPGWLPARRCLGSALERVGRLEDAEREQAETERLERRRRLAR